MLSCAIQRCKFLLQDAPGRLTAVKQLVVANRIFTTFPVFTEINRETKSLQIKIGLQINYCSSLRVCHYSSDMYMCVIDYS